MSTLWNRLSDTEKAAKAEEAKALAKLGLPTRTIAERTGLTFYMTACLIIPGFREKEQDRTKNYNRKSKAPPSLTRKGEPQNEREARQPPQPYREDTRPFTARFCGDPLPGRSARDLKQQGQAR